MTLSEEIGLGGLAAIGTIGSVCAILLKSTHQNLKTLDTMRREAAALADKLRQELRDQDDTIFKLQGLCADYRYCLGRYECKILSLQVERRQLLSEIQSLRTAEEPSDEEKGA